MLPNGEDFDGVDESEISAEERPNDQISSMDNPALEGAQQYTMKSMTLNKIDGQSSDTVTNSKENKSELTNPPVAIGLFYQGGPVLRLLP